jgi:hypothetical protein
MLETNTTISEHGRSWFVYLFALADCTAFKVGFSCHPLQRIYTFSRRYFERFDLSQSVLLELGARDDARAVEAALKTELAEFRAASPAWIPEAAGGQTEWFGAVYFSQAEERLQSFAHGYDARLSNTADYVRGELDRMSAAFEQWAWQLANCVSDVRLSLRRGTAPNAAAGSLRDWLDAYRFFDVPVFVDDAEVGNFVVKSAACGRHPRN